MCSPNVVRLDNTQPFDTENPELNAPEIDPAAMDQFLGNLQGNILKFHGRDHLELRFLQVLPSDPETRQKTQRALLQALAGCVTTAAIQARQTKDLKKAQAEGIVPLPQAAFVSVLMTKDAFRNLGITRVSDPWTFTKNAAFWRSPPPVNHPNYHYDPQYYDNPTAPVTVVVLIAHAHPEGCRHHWNDAVFPLIKTIEGWKVHESINGGALQETVETGLALRASRQDPATGKIGDEKVEHFGYRDGISHPRFLTTDSETTPWNSFRPLDKLLVKEGRHGGDNCFGSFFVLMKLEQNPRAFQAYVKAKCPDDPEKYYADLMGRWRNGQPLAAPAGELHQFDYGPKGASSPGACPFHAHIRRANPRDSADIKMGKQESEVLFPRRSLTYGKRALRDGVLDETMEPPTGGVGILFMGCMSSIDEQFDVTLDKWLREPNFPPQPVPPGAPPPARRDEILFGANGPDKFVIARGRLNLFAPSKTALLNF